MTDLLPPLFNPVPRFPHCERCGTPSDSLQPLMLPVLIFQSETMVSRKVCWECRISLRKWWFGDMTFEQASAASVTLTDNDIQHDIGDTENA